MFKHLLYATDLLEGSHRAGLRAKSLADYTQAKLSIIHSIEYPLSEQYAQALGFSELALPSIDAVRQVLATFAEELAIPEQQQYVCQGKAASTIMNTAETIGADGIIIGSHAHTALPNFLGSTANAIVHSAYCDVITLRISLLDQEAGK